MATIGLSPKLIPAVLAVLVGFGLLVLGEHDTGLAVLLTGVGALGLGYAAPPGSVTTPQIDGGSDSRLTPDAAAQINQATDA